ncbi:unnamed protein product [Brassica oleracea]|uniref:(rape) hypothetical protein n=1 Tax=Brassica napus TaxID=3708 RepID=A0A816IH18_BRANA|nr:unnamed protein product [Brassica napus]
MQLTICLYWFCLFRSLRKLESLKSNPHKSLRRV